MTKRSRESEAVSWRTAERKQWDNEAIKAVKDVDTISLEVQLDCYWESRWQLGPEYQTSLTDP